MARKNLLKGLMEAATETKPAKPARLPAKGQSAAQGAGQGQGTVRGAVGAVSQSLAALKARAVEELDPHAIEAGGLLDRLEHDEDDHARLMNSMQTYGQQVPVLVRPHPETPGRYQIVYGRRRVLAARDLGIRIKAMIRDLDDQDLVLAQGQENTARRDLSFIEKANFALQMVEAGYKRQIIADALSIDKTQISRMLSIVRRIPKAGLYAIGSAPGIGRDRWMMLADLMDKTGIDGGGAAVLAYGPTSDARFEALVEALAKPDRRRKARRDPEHPDHLTPPPSEGRRHPLDTADGTRLGHYRKKDGTLTITLSADDDFAEWLAVRVPDLHARWRKGG